MASAAASASAGSAMDAAPLGAGMGLLPLPPRTQSAPDAEGVSTVTEYRHGPGGMVEKHVMRIKTVLKTTKTPRAAVARMARMRKFGAAAAEGSTDNVTYYDYNLVKLKRPGDEDDSAKEVEAMVEALKAKMAAGKGAGKGSSAAAASGAGGAAATNSWAAKFDAAKDKGIMGAAEMAAAGGGAAASSTGKYVVPGASGKAGMYGSSAETEANTTSLKVSNLASDVYEADLYAIFEAYGRLKRVHVMADHRTGESRGFAFVAFHLRSEAQAAMDGLRGYGLKNMIIEIEWAKPNVRSGESSMRHATGYGSALPQG